MPCINKEGIRINAYDNSVRISTSYTAQKKIQIRNELPLEADIETVKCT